MKHELLLAMVAYISKTNSVTPLFFLKSNQKSETKLSAKSKKNLSSGFKATLILWFFKVALNPLDRILLNFTESFIMAF